MGDATQVLTSENAEAFYAKKLGITSTEQDAPAVAEASEPEQEETKVEETPQVEAEQQEEEAKPEDEQKDGRLKKRFSELTAKRKEAEARAAALEAELQQYKAPKQEAPKAEPTGEPQPHQFQDVFEYQKAVAVWAAEQVQSEREQERAQKEAATAEQARISEAIKRQDEYRKTVEDYDDVVDAAADAGVMISNVVREAMLDSEFYPQILYHLASNVEEAKAIAKMSPVQAVRAIGKLEAKFEGTPVAKAAPVKAVEVSKAPPPISPLKGGSAKPEAPINSNGEYVGDFQTWKAMRKAGKIK